ncbi:MAG TPA: UDP-3-O-(3-hydroxymyristoyl)glucosamine N-acyltransferase [Burkholderiales bacterium]|nr:UDP-3-O-(3-hydroxymyristoyl)glucosamine N-acyltransferase [Burkholderiales bacterium]
MNDNDLSLSLQQIADRFGAQVVGDSSIRVCQVATLEQASGNQVSFLTQPRYQRQAETSRAGAIIVAPADAAKLPARALLISENPYALFARLSAHFNPPAPVVPGVHPRAAIHSDARIDPSARVDACAVIAADAVVGANSWIGPGSSIGPGVQIGADCRLHANVSIYAACRLGDRVIVHSGAVIGADGFGLAMEQGSWRKIPQIGRVLIGNDVEVGANTTIDRGALDDTIIEDDVKLDNQIQIGHNCRIGAHTAIAGCVGIAGSTRIGRYCRIGGSAMIGGHLEIVDKVEIGGATPVAKSILKPGHYSGVFPISTHQEWLKNAAHIRRLDILATRIKELEARLADMERNDT